jgi:hypothetical protein
MNASKIIHCCVLTLFVSCTTPSESSINDVTAINVEYDSLAHESDLLPDIYDIMLPLGNDVVETLDPFDTEKLYSFVQPGKKLLFSPYLYINTETAISLNKNELNEALNNEKTLNWGEFDGSGDPIELTIKQYLNRFVYDKPYKKAPLYDVNVRIGQGNSLDNTFEIFPNAIFIEFHFDGFDPELNGLDWRTLRMVFEKVSDTYYLIALIHDEWTI